MRLRTTLKVIAGTIIVLSLCLVALELLLTLLIPAPRIIKISITAPSGGTYELSENFTLVYVPRPNAGGFNSDGYRGKLYPLARRPGTTRIVFIGDSVTEGVYVPTGQRFSDLLDEKLGPDYEVINLGVPGYNLVQEVEYVREKAVRYKPDYVIVGVSVDDEVLGSNERRELEKKMEKMGNSAFYKAYYEATNSLDNKLLRFNTYRYIRILLGRMLRRNESVPPDAGGLRKMSRGVIRERLHSLSRLAEKHGFMVSLIFFAGANGAIADNIKAVAEEEGLPVWEMAPYIAERFDEDFYRVLLMDFGHFNRLGHKIIADMIYEHYNFPPRRFGKSPRRKIGSPNDGKSHHLVIDKVTKR